MINFFRIIILIFALSSFAHSQDKIKLEIIGNDRINSDTIMDIIDFNENKNYELTDLNQFQKKLIQTDFFKNVIINKKNDEIIIQVLENPLVDFFYIDGVKNKNREDLIFEKINLSQNKLYSENLLKKDIEIIKNIFKNSGYLNVDIEPKLSVMANNTINIVMNISRGEKYKIGKIYFIGNKYFKSSRLLNNISSTEYGWWKFFSSSSTLNLARLDYDATLIKNFYLNNGFYDVQVLSSEVNIIEENYVSLTFTIDSGNQYSFYEFDIVDKENNLNQNQIDKISKLSKKKLNKNYSKIKIDELRDEIYDFLNIKKIEFIEFDIITNKNTDNNQILTKIIFDKARPKYVNNIKITGNDITEEKVLRRELLFAEGDSFSKYKVNKSINNLKSTGIFKDIKIRTDSIDNQRLDVNLDVEEQPTGSISAGVGIGSAGSAITSSIKENNLFGTGIKLNSNITFGTEKISGNVSNTIPDFNNKDNDLIFNVYAISTDYENAGYESSVAGSSISTNYDILENISINPGIGFDIDSVDTNTSASQLLQSRDGKYITLKSFYNIRSDTRDNRFLPTNGSVLSFGQTLALPGSDVTYLGNSLFGSHYKPLSEDFILNFKSGLNTINALNNNDIKLSDRKFLTSSNLRGFESYGVGPKDGSDHIGGNYSFFTSVSSTFPNPAPESWNAKTLMFLDVGNVWGVDYDSSLDTNKLRSSFGVGFDWISPLGPINFTFSQVLSSDEGDIEENFNFQLGSSF